MTALPGFRKVSDNVAEQWSGKEENPAFIAPLHAVFDYKIKSQRSKYWWMMVLPMPLVLLCDLAPRPFSLYLHILLAVVLFAKGVQAAFAAARAHRHATRADAEANRKMNIGVFVDEEADEKTEEPSPA
jgi:hypothetical protein